MEITFNAIGVVSAVSTSEGEFRQGNVGNQIKAYFTGKDNVNYVAKINFTRPDESHLDNVIMGIIVGSTNGFVLTMNSSWYLAKSGTATATIYLYDGGGNIIAQGQVSIPIEASDYNEDDPSIDQEQYDSLVAEVATKLNIINGFVILNNLTTLNSTIENYDNGQFFYIEEEESFYKNNDGVAQLHYNLNAYRDKIGLIKRSGAFSGTSGLSEAQLTEAKKQYCFMLYTAVSPREIYMKVSGVASGETESSIKFVKIDDGVTIDNNSKIAHYHYKSFAFNGSGQLTYQTNTNVDHYTEYGADQTFVNFSSDQEIGGKKTFAQLPETKANRTYGNQRQMADKELVDQVQTNLNTHAGRTDNPHSVNASQVGLGNVTNNPQVKRSEMGVPLGVATLDANGKLVYAQIPDILLGQMIYGGTVTGAGLATLSTNAKNKLATSENTLQLTNDTTALTGYTSNEGLYYLVTSTGAFAGLDLQQGDWLVANASGWSKIDNTDAVRSVQGRTGDVVIVKSDLGLEYIESDIAPLYDDTATYSVGDVVVYQGKLYVANTAVEFAESFDSTKWTETNVKTLLSNLKLFVDNELLKLPQYVDLTISTSDSWLLNTETNRYELSKSTGVLDLTNDDIVLALPNGKESDAYIRIFDIIEESFDNTTGVVTFSCAVEPTESINITLQILRR